MNNLWLGAVGAAIAVYLVRKQLTGGPGKTAEPVSPSTPAPAPARPPALADAADVQVQQIPGDLQAYRPVLAEDLSPDRRQAIFTLFRSVPRPPRLLQQLLSPEFLNTASSAQLVDLINAEPLIAARLMAAVNSPMYGLQRPASGVEQAVIYLGVSTVRAICLQYILIATFKPEDGARVKRLEANWLASALASEMAQQLCQDLLLESSGAMVSAVVLSFLGRLAIVGSSPVAVLAKIPEEDFLARSRAEQQAVGLTAAELGRLLMTTWELPAEVIADASDIDAVLTRPSSPACTDREARLALCYFCARVGERLADGHLTGMKGLAVIDDAIEDFFHFRSYLGHPWLRNLEQAAASPALAARLQRMLDASRAQ